MSDIRDILERVGSHVATSDDPFERLSRRRTARQRNRRVGTAIIALAIALGGSLGAFAAFRGRPAPSRTPVPITVPPNTYLPALWPETTRDQLSRTARMIHE